MPVNTQDSKLDLAVAQAVCEATGNVEHSINWENALRMGDWNEDYEKAAMAIVEPQLDEEYQEWYSELTNENFELWESIVRENTSDCFKEQWMKLVERIKEEGY